MKIIPLSEHYFKDGAYHPKSVWSKRFKIGLATGLIIAGLIPQITTPHIFSAMNDTKYAVKDAVYVDYIQAENPTVKEGEALRIVNAAIKYSKEFNLDEKLLLAIMKQESNFQKHAISSSGAFGLMQVMPHIHFKKLTQAASATGSPELFSIDTSIYMGAWVFKQCLESKKNLTAEGLKCYNGSSTNGYDSKVMAHYQRLSKLVKENT